MRHGRVSSRLGVKTAHRMAMLRNLTLGLVEHGRIKTTVARARRLRTFVEPLVTALKSPTVANIRHVNSILPQKNAVMKLAKEIAPKFKDRPGGYLRIMKLAGYRAGDKAEMALIEWVEESLVRAYNEPVKAPAAKKKAATKKASKKETAEGADEKSDKAVKKAKTAKSTK